MLELRPGLTVITGETGAGKTMVVTGLGLLLGGRADTGAVRTGAEERRVEGRCAVATGRVLWPRPSKAGGEVEDGELLVARNVSAEGRSRAYVGRRSVPGLGLRRRDRAAGRRARPVRPAPARQPRTPARALDRFAGDAIEQALARYAPDTPSAASAATELDRA